MPRLLVSRIARGSSVGALIAIAAMGLAQPARAHAETAHGSVSGCPSSPGIKPLIRGLVDRGVAPPATGLNASSINVGWNQLEPSGPGLIADNPIDQAITAAGCTPLRIRVLAGIATPAWVTALTGAVNVTNPYSNTPGVAGDFWTSEYQTLYDNLESELASAYEGVPNVAEFVVSRCALFYPEPFILGTSIATNDMNLLGAGYTEAADKQCEQEEIDTAKLDWPTTRIGVSFNPYQTLVPASNGKGYTVGADEAYTQQMMAYCRSTLGQRCVLENDSIRDPISAVGGAQPYYTEMYAAMVGLGAPLAFQTATAGGIGDFWGTLEWAAQQHAASVELPLDGTYPVSGSSGAPPWQTLTEVSPWFRGDPMFSPDPVSTTQGTSTAGDVVGTVGLNELAAFDTQVSYGDVGSVPFDSVTAVITWPNHVVQAGLVSLGTGAPASSVTCAAAATCTVTVFSGGYTFPEFPVSGPGSVAITLANGGVAYTPVDGVAMDGTFPLTVVPAPLTLKTFTVTPARAAPTATLAATFADADPLGVVADYTIKVTWGDGTSSTLAASVTSKGFSVSATHRYKRAGKDTVTITIIDTGGATVSGSKSITLR